MYITYIEFLLECISDPINLKFGGFEMIKFYYFNCLYYYFLQLIFFSYVSGLKEVKSSILCGWISHYRCV